MAAIIALLSMIVGTGVGQFLRDDSATDRRVAERLSEIDITIARIETKLDGVINAQLSSLDRRLGKMEQRVDAIPETITAAFQRHEEKHK